jgi:hypothetical protein
LRDCSAANTTPPKAAERGLVGRFKAKSRIGRNATQLPIRLLPLPLQK